MLSRLPPATRYLLIANIVLSLTWMVAPWAWTYPFNLWPWLPANASATMPSFMPWQLVTHAFLHSDLVHLMLNMLGLVMFGAMLEYEWGTRRFLVFYSVCVLGAALCQFGLATWMAFERGEISYGIGASGGIYGLLVAFGLLFPNQRLGLFFLPITFKARHFVAALIVLQLIFAVFGGRTGESHIAHLGGAFFGWALIRYWARDRTQTPKGPKRPRRPSYLRPVP
jgi:membrane associated rhomboid family serine protease